MALKYSDFQRQYYREDELERRDIEYFQHKFDCRIEDSKEYRHYVRQMPYYKWDGREPYNIETEVVPMKAIHLTVDNLKRLVAEQELMYSLKKDAEEGKRLWRQECEDSRIRNQNLAVEKAWRNYQMLLELAR
jgi:hypothetical protein